MQGRGRQCVGAVIALALVVGACASSDPVESGTNGGAAPGAANGTDVAAGEPTTDTAPPSGDGAAQGDGGGGGGAAGGGASSPASPSATAAGGAPVTARPAAPTVVPPAGPPGPGVSGDKIAIGVVTVQDVSAVNRGFGVTGGTVAFRAAQEALVKYVNANGGLGGRRVEPIYHAMDGTSSQSFATQAQALCTNFTEQHKVFAVMGWTPDVRSSVPCLARKGVISFPTYGDIVGDAGFYAKYSDHYYTPSYPNLDRASKLWVSGLAAQGYFNSKGKYGLLYYSYQADAVARSLEPALKAAGVSLAAKFQTEYPSSLSAVGALVADVQSAILRFKSAGVDHVMMFDSRATQATFFTQGAEQQSYRPRYGLNSFNNALFMKGNAPAAQLKNSLVAGWVPTIDMDKPAALNANEALCLQIMSSAGVTLPTGDIKSQALDLCDIWFLLKAGLDRAGTPNAAGFRAGVEGLGATYASPRTYATLWGPGRPHDGVVAAGRSRYDDGCGCYVASGPITRSE